MDARILRNAEQLKSRKEQKIMEKRILFIKLDPKKEADVCEESRHCVLQLF